MLNIFRRRPVPDISDAGHGLVVADNDYLKEKGKETRKLAEMLDSRGAEVLCTSSGWPRDELFFYPDGSYDYVQKATVQPDFYDHEAFHGGRVLKGTGFIVASDAVPEDKRTRTEELMGAEDAAYLDMGTCLEALSGVAVSGNAGFYKTDGYRHIDAVMNICNRAGALVTYDLAPLTDAAETAAARFGYRVEAIPADDASFAAVGFVEIGNSAVVDCRAKKTMDVLEGLGYEAHPTPGPMKATNHMSGSVRCVCTEMPLCRERLRFYPFKGNGDIRTDALHSIFWNLDGYKVRADGPSGRRLY